MPEDLYSEQETVTESPEPMESPESSEETPMEEGDDTSLLPRSMFPKEDLKVGDTCEFKVVSIIEDEVEVAYANESKKPMMEEKTMDMKIEEAAV